MQQVYINNATGGTFTLTFDGQTTAALARNATAGEIEAALEALSNIDDVSVIWTGMNHNVTFQGSLSATDVPQLIIDGSNLTNSDLKNVLTFEYNAVGQLTFAGDQFGEYEYGYDGMGRLLTETQNIVGLPEVVFTNGYNAASARTTVSATINGTADFLRTYTRDAWDRVTYLVEAGQGGGNGVVRKEIDFDYNAAHQYELIERYEGTSPTFIASSSYIYDDMGRLKDLHHESVSATLARYQFVFDTASRIEQITSHVDGVSNFTHDPTNQLTAADHAGSGPPDESYDFDANGNRDGSGYTVDPNNQISTDGTYNYTYDDEGNRESRTHISSGNKEEYTWDHRNRLVTITFKNNSNVVTKTVDQTYDVFNQWIKRTVDPDGAGAAAAVDTYFAHEADQITFQWEDADGAGGSAPAMSHRYLWAEGVDQFLADEQISTPGSAGNVLWGLGDHLGTLRDIVDLSGSTVSVVNHRDYNSFGSLTSETNSAIDLLFGYTGRPWDEASGLQNNVNRWFDVVLKQWLNEDPIGFGGRDGNLRRYVKNRPTLSSDANGLIETTVGEWVLNKDNTGNLLNKHFSEAGIVAQLARARKELWGLEIRGVIDQADVHLRLIQVETVLRSKMIFGNKEEPDPKYYEKRKEMKDGKPVLDKEGKQVYTFRFRTDENKPGMVFKGLESRVFRKGENGLGSQTGCTMAAQVMMFHANAAYWMPLPGYAKALDAACKGYQVDDFFDNDESNGLYEYEYNEAGISAADLIPGDRVYMKNHKFDGDLDPGGHDGSNVFYVGKYSDDQRLFAHMQGPDIETFKELQRTVRNYSKQPARQDSNIDNYKFTERYKPTLTPPALRKPGAR